MHIWKLLLLSASAVTVVDGLSRFVDHWTTVLNDDADHLRSNRITRQSRRKGDNCLVKCSFQLMLPCSFPSLDRCLERSCKDICRQNKQVMNSCFCQSVKRPAEGRRKQEQTITYRACYCQPSQKDIKEQLEKAQQNSNTTAI